MPQSGGEQLIQLGINSILTSPIGTPGHDQIFGTNTPTVTGVPLLNSLNGDKNHNIVNIPTRPSDAFISNNTLGAVAVSEGNAGEIDSIPNFPFENNILNIFEDNDKSYSFRPPVGSNGDMAQTLTNNQLPGLIDMAGGVQQGWLILDLGSMYRLSGVSISLSHGSAGHVEVYATSAVPSVELTSTAGYRKIMDFNNTDSTAGTAVAPESVLNISTTFPDNRTFTFSNQLNSTTLPGQLNPVNNLSQDISSDASGNQVFSRFLIFQFSDFQGYFNGNAFRFKVDISNISIKQLIPTNVLDPNNPKIKRPVVEFDDALLDLEGWRNPRYVGSKLNAKEINKFTPPDLDGSGRGYKGDITYGKNPVIERKTTAIYIADSCIGAEDEDENFAFITDHSYIGIKQILIIDQDKDEIVIIDRSSETEDVFQNFITRDFPVGSAFSTRIIDESIQHRLKRNHFVKFNRGNLLKSFEYDGGKGPKHGHDFEGNSLTELITPDDLGLFGQDREFIKKPIFLNHQHAGGALGSLNPDIEDKSVVFDPCPLKLVEEIGRNTDVFFRQQADLVDPDFGTDIADQQDPMRRFGIGHFGELYRGFKSFLVRYDYMTNPLMKIYSGFGYDGEDKAGQLKFQIGGTAVAPLMFDSNTKLIRNKFTKDIVKSPAEGADLLTVPSGFELMKLDTESNLAGMGGDIIIPEEIYQTMMAVGQVGAVGAFGSTLTFPFNDPKSRVLQFYFRRNFILDTFSTSINVTPSQGLPNELYDGKNANFLSSITGTRARRLGKAHPNNIPLSFIRGIVDHAKNKNLEIFLTLHRGEKDYSIDSEGNSDNGQLSIGTFEIDPTSTLNDPLNFNTGELLSESGSNSATYTGATHNNAQGEPFVAGMRENLIVRNAFLNLRTDARVMPMFEQLIPKDKDNFGKNTTLITVGTPEEYGNAGQFNLDEFMTGRRQMLIFCSRVKLFDQGPGIFSLKDVDPITGATTSFPNAPGSTFSFLGTPAPTANGGLQHGFYPYFAHGPTSTSDDNIFGNGNYLQPEPLDHGTIQLDNTGNYPRSNKLDYHYQISFVDKGPILTTDIDKETELFDGIGEKGLVLVPDLLEGDIKKNIDFFLRKAGIIERRTIKSPFRPERGR